MNKFIMLIGLPASGKSTIAEEYTSNGYICHSSDTIREELFDNVNHQADNQLIFETLHKRVREDLLAGEDVVYDATNLSMKRRRGFIRQWLNGLECAKTVVIVATPFNECVQRDHNRERTVGVKVLDRMYKSFNFPLLQEGFDFIEIKYAHINHFEFDICHEVASLQRINQCNSNHTKTIGDHCIHVGNQFINFDDYSRGLYYAGLLHDFGKKHTLSFVNSKGYYSDQAHYYSHENVSAYDAMFYMQPFKADTLEVCQLVNYHMKPHLLNTEKSIKRFVDFVGEDFWHKLKLLNDADLASR